MNKIKIKLLPFLLLTFLFSTAFSQENEEIKNGETLTKESKGLEYKLKLYKYNYIHDGIKHYAWKAELKVTNKNNYPVRLRGYVEFNKWHPGVYGTKAELDLEPYEFEYMDKESKIEKAREICDKEEILPNEELMFTKTVEDWAEYEKPIEGVTLSQLNLDSVKVLKGIISPETEQILKDEGFVYFGNNTTLNFNDIAPELNLTVTKSGENISYTISNPFPNKTLTKIHFICYDKYADSISSFIWSNSLKLGETETRNINLKWGFEEPYEKRNSILKPIWIKLVAYEQVNYMNIKNNPHNIKFVGKYSSDYIKSTSYYNWLDVACSDESNTNPKKQGGVMPCSNIGEYKLGLKLIRKRCRYYTSEYEFMGKPYSEHIRSLTSGQNMVKTSETNDIKALENKLQEAIENENYEEAAKLRDQIKKLNNGPSIDEQINALNEKIKKAVSEERYEDAAELKKQKELLLSTHSKK